ncbi:unnamed protein product [Amoebophrya sp. A25]|nr:unnamed protein product [Amoebophrya sp. A25]|eukprot:GSA25T00004486001.1
MSIHRPRARSIAIDAALDLSPKGLVELTQFGGSRYRPGTVPDQVRQRHSAANSRRVQTTQGGKRRGANTPSPLKRLRAAASVGSGFDASIYSDPNKSPLKRSPSRGSPSKKHQIRHGDTWLFDAVSRIAGERTSSEQQRLGLFHLKDPRKVVQGSNRELESRSRSRSQSSVSAAELLRKADLALISKIEQLQQGEIGQFGNGTFTDEDPTRAGTSALEYHSRGLTFLLNRRRDIADLLSATSLEKPGAIKKEGVPGGAASSSSTATSTTLPALTDEGDSSSSAGEEAGGGTMMNFPRPATTAATMRSTSETVAAVSSTSANTSTLSVPSTSHGGVGEGGPRNKAGTGSGHTTRDRPPGTAPAASTNLEQSTKIADILREGRLRREQIARNLFGAPAAARVRRELFPRNSTTGSTDVNYPQQVLVSSNADNIMLLPSTTVPDMAPNSKTSNTATAADAGEGGASLEVERPSTSSHGSIFVPGSEHGRIEYQPSVKSRPASERVRPAQNKPRTTSLSSPAVDFVPIDDEPTDPDVAASAGDQTQKPQTKPITTEPSSTSPTTTSAEKLQLPAASELTTTRTTDRVLASATADALLPTPTSGLHDPSVSQVTTVGKFASDFQDVGEKTLNRSEHHLPEEDTTSPVRPAESTTPVAGYPHVLVINNSFDAQRPGTTAYSTRRPATQAGGLVKFAAAPGSSPQKVLGGRTSASSSGVDPRSYNLYATMSERVSTAPALAAALLGTRRAGGGAQRGLRGAAGGSHPSQSTGAKRKSVASRGRPSSHLFYAEGSCTSEETHMVSFGGESRRSDLFSPGKAAAKNRQILDVYTNTSNRRGGGANTSTSSSGPGCASSQLVSPQVVSKMSTRAGSRSGSSSSGGMKAVRSAGSLFMRNNSLGGGLFAGEDAPQLLQLASIAENSSSKGSASEEEIVETGGAPRRRAISVTATTTAVRRNPPQGRRSLQEQNHYPPGYGDGSRSEAEDNAGVEMNLQVLQNVETSASANAKRNAFREFRQGSYFRDWTTSEKPLYSYNIGAAGHAPKQDIATAVQRIREETKQNITRLRKQKIHAALEPVVA